MVEYIVDLLSYHDRDGYIKHDNFIPASDRKNATLVQPNNVRDIGKGQVTDNIRKTKTILVVDDDKETTRTIKSTLELENNNPTNKIFFQVDTHNIPLQALSEFKPHFYDLLLLDVEMPNMNGFELGAKIMSLDPDPKICFLSVAEVNYEALKEIYPSVSFGFFIKKPVSLEYLIGRIRTELDLRDVYSR